MTSQQASSKTENRRSRPWLAAVGPETIVAGLCVVAFVGFAVAIDGAGPPTFLTAENLFTLLRSASVLGLLGLAMGLVVLQRGIDLSLVAIMAVSAGWFLQLVQDGTSMPVALVYGLLFALAVGLWNGVASGWLEIPPIFATLAASLFVYGLGRSRLMSLEVVYAPSDAPAWFDALGSGRLLGVPVPILLVVVCAALVALYLARTRPGRFTYAMGDNPLSARLVGIAVRPSQTVNFMLAAAIAYLCGLIVASSVSSMNVRVAKGMMIYDVILVVVLGGIGLSGGRGRVRGILVSMVLIGTLVNGMTLLDVPLYLQNIVRAVILLTAIVMDSLANPRNEETTQQGDI